MQGHFLLLSCISLVWCDVPELEKEIVVIGGGIAGLAAARKICNEGRGRFAVRVFEARRERYGGRVWTNRLRNPRARGLEVDLGGATLSVVSQFTNPLLNLTRDLDLQTAVVERPQFVVPWLGTKFMDDSLTEATLVASSVLSDAVNSTRHLRKDISVREAVDAELKRRGLAPHSAGSLLVRSLPSYVVPDYSALHYQADSLDFGFDKVLLDGMGEILDRLASGTEGEMPLKIDLRTAVRQVKVDKGQNKVILRLKDGSQVTVDRVVVAVPAPVIGNGDLMFEPALPKEYQSAAENIALVDGNKVIVEFDSAFWSDDFGVFIAAAETEEDRGNLQTWLNLHKLMSKPALVGLLLGNPAKQLESLSDEEVKDLVLQKLRGVFGKEALSADNIVNIQRSAWSSDQWSGGSHSYPSVGTNPKLWDTFAEPLCPYVYFAGEHTVFRGHGTLHGAYLSGMRAADQLLNGHCEQKALEEEKRRKEEEKRKKKNVTSTSDNEGEEKLKDSAESQPNTADDAKDEL